MSEVYIPFELNTDNSDFLCTDEQIDFLMGEIEEYPDSIFDDPEVLAEQKILAKAYLESRIGRHILYRDIANEIHDGTEKTFLYVKRPPILSVASVEFITDGIPVEKVVGTDYWVYEDHLQFSGEIPRGHQNIRVSYRSGVSSIVSPLTADTIAKVVARSIIIQVGSGPAAAEDIRAGPVGLKESFGAGGKYAPKLTTLTDDIDQWIAGKIGLRIRAVGKQKYPHGRGLLYNPRKDIFE